MEEDQIIDPTIARALQTDVARTRGLYRWAIWHDTPDYPGKFIARLVTEGPTLYVLMADTLAKLRAKLPPGLEPTERRQFDLPELVEIWLAA